MNKSASLVGLFWFIPTFIYPCVVGLANCAFSLVIWTVIMASEIVTSASEEAAPIVEVQAEVEAKKEPVLTPAPIPTKSPWKSVSADIPVSNIQVDSLEAGKKKKNKAGTPAISSSTKWVPMKASFVVSGPKRAGNNPRKTSNKGAATGGAKKKKQQQQQSTKRQPSKTRSPKDDSGKEKIEVQQESEEKPSQDEAAASDQQNGHSFYQRRRHNHNNQFQHSAHQQTNFPRRRYYNNFNNNDPFGQQRYAQHSKDGFNPYHGRIPRSFGQQGHLINNQVHPNIAPIYQQYYSMQPILMAVNSIARQIEYYFSAENLNKDNYLRSKLSNEGYASVSLISKFYRVVNMSFGGDSSLILAALREIVKNEDATVEVATGSIENSEGENAAESEGAILTKYFVRAKEWQSLLPETFTTVVEIEKTLEGDALDGFMINPIPVPSNGSYEPQVAVSEEGLAEKSEEEKSSLSTLEDAKVETQ